MLFTRKIAILFSLLLWSILQTKAQDFSKQLQDAFLKKDKSRLQSVLSSNFSIAGHTDETAQFRLEQIIDKYPISAFKQLENKKEKSKNTILLQVQRPNNTFDTTLVHLANDGKIKHIDLFDKLYGMQRLPKAKLRASIPFKNQAGAIIFQVYINNHPKPLNLLFDTGADGMAINEDVAKELNLTISRTNNASVVGGTQQIQVSDNNKIQIGELALDNMGIAIFPAHNDKHTDGLIGNTLLKRFLTEVNYDQSIINLYDFGAFEYPKKGFTVPISLPESLIEIPANLELVTNKKAEGRFIFDTGASYNLICFRPFVRDNKMLVSGFKPQGQTFTVSFGINTPTFFGNAAGFAIQGLPNLMNMPVSLMGGSGSENQWNPTEQGSIGNRLIARYNLIVNIAEGEIHFSPNKLYEQPFDFVIHSAVLGWNENAQLVILTDPARKEIHDKTDLPIKEINGLSIKDLVKKKENIQNIIDQSKKGNISVHLEDGSILSI